jgi:hypothetical protein
MDPIEARESEARAVPAAIATSGKVWPTEGVFPDSPPPAGHAATSVSTVANTSRIRAACRSVRGGQSATSCSAQPRRSFAMLSMRATMVTTRAIVKRQAESF